MIASDLRLLAAKLLPHVGVEPLSPEEVDEAAAMRSRLQQIIVDEQPAPQATIGQPIWELVVSDMQARDQLGRRRYGVPLQAGNGRDALRDAYEEALDLAVYLRQAIEERG